jgi:hypothetical protein
MLAFLSVLFITCFEQAFDPVLMEKMVVFFLHQKVVTTDLEDPLGRRLLLCNIFEYFYIPSVCPTSKMDADGPGPCPAGPIM